MDISLGWKELSDDDYNSLEAIRSGDLSLILRSPLHYKKRVVSGEKDFFRFGRLVHKLILEPEKASYQIKVAPKSDKRTKTGKEAWAQFEDSLGLDDLCVSFEEYERAKTIQDAVLSHESVQRIFANGIAECAGLYKDNENDLFKIKPDYRRFDGVLVDLKTTTDCSHNAFASSVVKYRYALQAAYYLDIASRISPETYNQFIWIVVEKEPPFDVALYFADTETINLGRRLYQKALSLYKECKLKDCWPGSPRQIQPLKLPTYAFLEA